MNKCELAVLIRFIIYLFTIYLLIYKIKVGSGQTDGQTE